MSPANCNHKKCIREKRKECTVIAARKRRERYRAQGMFGWEAEGRSPTGYLRKLETTRHYRQTPEESKRYRAIYRTKLKQLYGGRPDSNIHARVKWLEAKANERVGKALY